MNNIAIKGQGHSFNMDDFQNITLACLSNALTLMVCALDVSRTQQACTILSKFTLISKYAVINLYISSILPWVDFVGIPGSPEQGWEVPTHIIPQHFTGTFTLRNQSQIFDLQYTQKLCTFSK